MGSGDLDSIEHRLKVEELILILIINFYEASYSLQNTFLPLLLMTSPALSSPPLLGCLGICFNGVSQCKAADTI